MKYFLNPVFVAVVDIEYWVPSFFLLVVHSTGHFDQMLTGHAVNQCACSVLVAHSTGHFDQMLTGHAVNQCACFVFLLVAHSTGHFDQMLTGHAVNQCPCFFFFTGCTFHSSF